MAPCGVEVATLRSSYADTMDFIDIAEGGVGIDCIVEVNLEGVGD
tara:strand:+ start:710 stop:844 length:135 start_codon:yes stop_codon:yes gene_type:complete